MINPVLTRRGLAAITLTATAATGVVVAATPADAVARLRCSARMSTSGPHQYSNVSVLVTTAAGASVHTTARYKTTSTSHSAKANSRGAATVVYYIARATKGRRVPVAVTVRKGRVSGSCSTAFTPR